MPETDPIHVMMDRILGYCRSQGLATVARLGIPDLLADGPRPVADLAREAEADPETLFRLMRALATEGVFEHQGDGVFAQSELSAGLTTDHQRSLRWFAAAMCDTAHWLPWGECHTVAREGRSQTTAVHGMGPWEYLAQHPNQAQRFGQAMSNMSAQAITAILANYDFSTFDHIVDVGGSRGALLLEVLGAAPRARGEIFDLPAVIEATRRELVDHPRRDRVQLSGGSFFESVPAGADCYVLKHILHDWPDADCLKILRNIRTAIRDDGRLLVFDALLVPEAPPWAHWLDMHMLVLQNGKERSPDEFAALFAAAGFELTRVLPIPAPVGILEVRPT